MARKVSPIVNTFTNTQYGLYHAAQRTREAWEE